MEDSIDEMEAQLKALDGGELLYKLKKFGNADPKDASFRVLKVLIEEQFQMTFEEFREKNPQYFI